MHILKGLDPHSIHDLDSITKLFNAKFGFAKRSKREISCALKAWAKEMEEKNEVRSRASEAGALEGPNSE